MKTKNIVMSCFVGGALCSTIALICTPDFWWFGLVAGIAGGYIGYEFREFCLAVPIAIRDAKKEVVTSTVNNWKSITDWLAVSHPRTYLSLILVTISTVFADYYDIASFHVSGSDFSKSVVAHLISVELYSVMFFVPISLAILIFSFIGSRQEHCYWYPFFMVENKHRGKTIRELKAKGFRYAPTTYWSVARWIAKGIWATVLFCLWTWWTETMCFFGRVALILLRLTYSDGRILCAINGTLGGVISYRLLVATSTTLSAQVALIVFGGILGIAFGLASKSLIPKLVLKKS